MPAFLAPPALPRAPLRKRLRAAPHASRKTITVDLPRPLGLVLEEAPGAPSSPHRARVVVARVDCGVAEGLVRVGDVVVATSSTFGDAVWPARSLDGAVSAIRSRCGDKVRLVLEREDDEAVVVAPPPRRGAGARSRPRVGNFEEAGSDVCRVEEALEVQFEDFAKFRTRRGAEALVAAAEEAVRAWGMGSVKRVAKMEALFRRLKRAEAPLGLKFYNVLMWSYVKAGAPERTVDVFDELPNPNVECYTTLAKALSVLGRPADAIEMLEKMRARAVMPNVFTYNSVIAACVKAGDVASVKTLFNEMEKTGVAPNVVSWNTLINWHARKKKGAERLAGTARAFEDMKASGVLPNAITYTTMMKSYAASGAMNKAEGIFEEMKRRYPIVTVDVGAYNTLLGAHAKRLDWRRCLELLDEMQLSGGENPPVGFVAEDDVYVVENDGFGRGGFLRSASSSRNVLSSDELSWNGRDGDSSGKSGRRREGVLDFEKGMVVKPDAVSYSLVIKALADARRIEIAHAVFNEMLADAFSPPPPHAIVSLMGAYAQTGDFQRSSEMLKRLKGWGIAPNLKMMTSFMTACVVGNQPNLALSVYAKIKASSTRPDVVAYTMLLRAYGMKGDMSKALSIVKAMTRGNNPVRPNIITYNELITCANENGRPDVALDALQMALDDRSVRVNDNTFHALVQRSAVDSQRFYGSDRLSEREPMDDGFGDEAVASDSEEEDSYSDANETEMAMVGWGDIEEPNFGTNIKGVSAEEYLEYLIEITRMVRNAGNVPNGTLYVALLEACETCGEIELGMKFLAERNEGRFRVGRNAASEVRLYEESIRSRAVQSQPSS